MRRAARVAACGVHARCAAVDGGGASQRCYRDSACAAVVCEAVIACHCAVTGVHRTPRNLCGVTTGLCTWPPEWETVIGCQCGLGRGSTMASARRLCLQALNPKPVPKDFMVHVGPKP